MVRRGRVGYGRLNGVELFCGILGGSKGWGFGVGIVVMVFGCRDWGDVFSFSWKGLKFFGNCFR